MSPRGSRILRIFGWTAGAVALWLALGFFAVPPIAKHVAEGQLTARLERETTIERIAFNPLTFEAVASNLVINEPTGTSDFVRIDELRVNLQAWRSLFTWAPVVHEVRFLRPQVSLIRNDDGRYNFSDLLNRRHSDGEAANASSKPARFSLNNIQVLDAAVVLEDRPNARTHVVDEILLSVPFLSSLPAHADSFIEAAFQGQVNGTAFSLEAKSKPFKTSRDTGIEIELGELDLIGFLPYLPFDLPVLVDSARLAGNFHVDFVRDPAGPDLLTISGRAGLYQLAAREKDGKPLLAAERLDVAIANLQPIARVLEFESIAGELVEAHLRRDRAGQLNLVALLPRPVAPGDAGARTTIRVGEIRLSESRIEFTDDSVRPRFARSLGSVAASATGIDTAARTPIATVFEAIARTGERVSQRGQIGFAPVAFSGEFSVSGANARHYHPYYAPYIRFSTQSGILDIRGTYALARDQGRLSGHIDLTNIDLRNGKLAPRGGDETFMSVTRGKLNGPRIDFDKKQVRFRSISSEGGEVFVHLDGDRRVNLATYFTRAGTDQAETSNAGTAPAEGHWSVELGNIKGRGATVRFRDDGAATSAEFLANSVSASSSYLSTVLGKSGRIETAFESGGGTAAASGAMTLRPFALELEVQLRDTDVLHALPYFADRINLEIENGRVSFDGKLAVGTTDIPAAGHIEGDVNIASFQSTDKATGDDLLSWRSLYLSGFRAGWLPAAVSFDEIALSDFYSRLIVRPDGSFNVQDVLILDQDDAQTTGEAGDAPPAPPIKINRITLQGGTVDFTDRFIQPNYSATLIDIGGTVAGLSSEPGTLADVDLRGRLDTGAPTEITGRINPLAGDLVMDMRGDIRGIELSRLSPYSGKYLGYGIERGTLSFRVHYQVEERELHAENQVTLNQLVFGERVESPDAIRVPVQLALSLLKDRNGVIDVNVPISGTLDDPEFSVGGIVMRIILNMMRRAVTSPFTFLANLVGAREELSHVEFDPGRSQLTVDARERLDSLAQALEQRPALEVSVVGRFDPDSDPDGLRRARLEAKVTAQKAAKRPSQDAEPGVPEELARDDYETWLRRAYLAEPFPKPRDERGQELDLPVEEMEKLMFAHMPIWEEDLIALAERRADEPKRYLVQQGGVAADRIAITAVQPLGEDARTEEKATRAEFQLR